MSGRQPIRRSVTTLGRIDGAWSLGPASTAQPVSASRYASFKHGDGSHLTRFAQALVAACAPALPAQGTPLYVTSSGYGRTPPAAAGLLDPSLDALRAAGWDARGFHTHRDSVTPADYATLDVKQRGLVLSADQLHARLPAGTLRGATVLALDDVVVTGVHERALEAALLRDGAARVVHGYLVDASGAASEPQVEAVLNGTAGSEPAALLALARSTHFVPNSRFLKAVLRLPSGPRTRLLASLPSPLVEWMGRGALSDGLEQVPDLADGVPELLRAAAACAHGASSAASA